MAAKIASKIERKKKASETLQPDQYLEPKWLRYLQYRALIDLGEAKLWPR